MKILKKLYPLTHIKYPWLLALSIVLFGASLYFNCLYPESFTKVEVQIYGADVAIAILWSILNYISSLELRNIYKKHDDIDEFVRRLTMSADDKEELIQYLNDFAKDLEQGGIEHNEAIKTAISHFQAKEFANAAQGDIFERPSHLYLFGYVLIFVALAFITQSIGVLTGTFLFSALSFTLGLYGFALFCLFFLYKLIDIIIAKK